MLFGAMGPERYERALRRMLPWARRPTRRVRAALPHLVSRRRSPSRDRVMPQEHGGPAGAYRPA